MPTASSWLGQGDINNAYIPNSLLYTGIRNISGWLGEHDTFHAWFPMGSILYPSFIGIGTNLANVISGAQDQFGELVKTGTSGTQNIEVFGLNVSGNYTILVDYAIVQNNLSSPGQSIAWSIVVGVSTSSFTIASAAPGAGPVARNLLTYSSSGFGTSQVTVAATISGAGPFSGTVDVKIYGIYLLTAGSIPASLIYLNDFATKAGNPVVVVPAGLILSNGYDPQLLKLLAKGNIYVMSMPPFETVFGNLYQPGPRVKVGR